MAQAAVINLWQLLFRLFLTRGSQSGLFKRNPKSCVLLPGAIFYVEKQRTSATLRMDGRCRAAEEDRRTSSSIAPQTHDLGHQGWETLYDKLKAHEKTPSARFPGSKHGIGSSRTACSERSRAIIMLLPSTAASKALEQARVDGWHWRLMVHGKIQHKTLRTWFIIWRRRGGRCQQHFPIHASDCRTGGGLQTTKSYGMKSVLPIHVEEQEGF